MLICFFHQNLNIAGPAHLPVTSNQVKPESNTSRASFYYHNSHISGFYNSFQHVFHDGVSVCITLEQFGCSTNLVRVRSKRESIFGVQDGILGQPSVSVRNSLGKDSCDDVGFLEIYLNPLLARCGTEMKSFTMYH